MAAIPTEIVVSAKDIETEKWKFSFEPLLEENTKQLKELNMRLRQLTSIFNKLERKLK